MIGATYLEILFQGLSMKVFRFIETPQCMQHRAEQIIGDGWSGNFCLYSVDHEHHVTF